MRVSFHDFRTTLSTADSRQTPYDSTFNIDSDNFFRCCITLYAYYLVKNYCILNPIFSLLSPVPMHAEQTQRPEALR